MLTLYAMLRRHSERGGGASTARPADDDEQAEDEGLHTGLHTDVHMHVDMNTSRERAEGDEGGGTEGGGAASAAPAARVSVAALRISRELCQRYGLVPRQVRQLTVSVATLARTAGKVLGLPSERLRLSAELFPRPGREGSFQLARLRLLMVWTHADRILSAGRQRQRRGDNGGSATGGAAEARVHLGSLLSEAQLATLLPPPTSWSVRTQCCDVVQAAGALLQPRGVVIDAVERLLVPWLAPEWVFVQLMPPPNGSPLHAAAGQPDAPPWLCVWLDVRHVAEARSGLGPMLQLEPAEIDAALAAARPCPPVDLLAQHAADPASYASMRPAAEHGGEPMGIPPAAAEAGTCFMRLEVFKLLTRPQQKALDHYRSRRGIAREHRVVALRAHPDGTASLTSANCLPLTVPTPHAEGRTAGGGGRAQAVKLADDAHALLTALLGPNAQLKAKPGQAEARQTLCFPTHGREAAAAQTPLAFDSLRQRPLAFDRPWGARLLCLMSSGHRDRVLRISGADGAGSSVAVPISCPIGLDWSLQPDGRRALLPRHSLLRVALPDTEEDIRLWAVGASLMVLGGGGGGGGGGGSSLVAIEGATLLPPGDEWLASVLCAAPGEQPMCMPAPCVLSIAQLADANAARLAFDPARLEVQPAAVHAVRRLLEPWLAGEADADAAAAAGGSDAPSECAICLACEHQTTAQLPCVECSTCHNKLHAACIYRWFRSLAAEQRSEAEQPPPATCPLCRSAF